MNKRLTALVLSVSIAATPLTSFAKEDIPNIEINNRESLKTPVQK